MPFKSSVLFLLAIDCSTQKPRGWLCTLWGKVLLCVSLNSGTDNEREQSYVPVWFRSQNRIKEVPRWGDFVSDCKKIIALVFKSSWKPVRSCPVVGKSTHSVYAEVTVCFLCSQESNRISQTAAGDQQWHSAGWEPTGMLCRLFYFPTPITELFKNLINLILSTWV